MAVAKPPARQGYRIGDAAARSGVGAANIRYYEKEYSALVSGTFSSEIFTKKTGFSERWWPDTTLRIFPDLSLIPSDLLAMNETNTHSRKKVVKTAHLTEEECERLVKQEPREYQDDKQPALRFYVSPAGAGSFGLYKWSPKDQMAIRKSLGRWRLKAGTVYQAREEARDLVNKIEKGEYTMTHKVTARAALKITLGSMLAEYERKLKQKGRRKPNWASVALKHSFEDWMKLPLAAITTQMIEEKRDEIWYGDEGDKKRPATAGVALKALRAVFIFAQKSHGFKGTITPSQVEFPEEKARERVLKPREREAILKALDEGPWLPYVKPYFRLLMLTGARRSNLAAAEWSELDLEEGTWTIPAGKSKSGYEMTVYLRDEAIEFFKGQLGLHEKWVFPSPKDPNKTKHLVDVWNIWKRVLAYAKVDPKITVHDLRRTYGSDLVSAGESISIVAEAMGHRNPATTAKHYAKVRASSVREALNRVKG